MNLIEFAGTKIRLVGSPENPEWVAADVCSVLGLSDVSMSLRGFKQSEKGTSSVCTQGGGVQEVLTVTEPGLYRLIFKSRKPEAERFRTWVTHEVLPSIRQHGCYPAPMVEVSSTALVAIDAQQLCIQLGKTFHDAVFSATQPRFDAIDESIVGLQNEFSDVKHRLNAIEQRKKIPAKTRSIHLHVVKNYYSGRCPCCHKNRIVNDAGDKRSNCEFDHFFRVSEVQVSKTWAVCSDCNSSLRDSDWKADRRVKFESYQQTRREFEKALAGPVLPGMDEQ